MFTESGSKQWSLYECNQKCEETTDCKEFEYNSNTKSCIGFKAVTFDERCTRLDPPTTAGSSMYTVAGYRFPDETLSKCTHRDLFNADYDVVQHCNAITTAKECTNDDVHIKLLRENTMCDTWDTNRIQSLTDKIYTPEQCNAICNVTAGCV